MRYDIDLDRFLVDRDPAAYIASNRAVIHGRRLLAEWERVQHG